MYIAMDCLEFFDSGKFELYKTKKECPSNALVLRVNGSCTIEVKFGYLEETGVHSRTIRKIRNKYFDVYKYKASFYNSPDDFSSKYEETPCSFRYITQNNLGIPVYCRTVHITKDFFKHKAGEKYANN